MYGLIFTIQLLFLLLHGVSFFEAFSARFYSWRPQYEEDNNKVTCIYVMYVRKPNNLPLNRPTHIDYLLIDKFVDNRQIFLLYTIFLL